MDTSLGIYTQSLLAIEVHKMTLLSWTFLEGQALFVNSIDCTSYAYKDKGQFC